MERDRKELLFYLRAPVSLGPDPNYLIQRTAQLKLRGLWLFATCPECRNALLAKES